MKIIFIIGLCFCLTGASWMIAIGIGILIAYLEDIVKERKKK